MKTGTNKKIMVGSMLAFVLVGSSSLSYASKEGDIERMRNANSARGDSTKKSGKQSDVDKARESTKDKVNRALIPPTDRVRSDTSRNVDRVLRK